MKIIIFAAPVLFCLGCGVKGDPLPPEKPVNIGRGQPTFRRAFKDVRIEQGTRLSDEEENEEIKKQERE